MDLGELAFGRLERDWIMFPAYISKSDSLNILPKIPVYITRGQCGRQSVQCRLVVVAQTTFLHIHLPNLRLL